MPEKNTNEETKILISYDGSSCAGDAIKDLPRAGLPREAQALIVAVQERWVTAVTSDSETVKNNVVSTNSAAAKPARYAEKPSAGVIAEQEKMLGLAAAMIGSFFPEWKTETLALKGSPAREIISQAKIYDADLIVLGSHGRTESKRFALGSVSQKVANEAACSVRVVRGQAWKNGSPSRLLIGLDGSRSAAAAVEEVARRMWIMGSEVRLIAVRDAFENNYKRVCAYLEEARKILERAELIVTELIVEGDPKQIIVSSAEEWGADCIFLGANDEENEPQNLLLGGVASAIVVRAQCNVEIVRRKAAKTV